MSAEGTRRTPSGTTLHYRLAAPAGTASPRATLVVVHGFGEYGTIYDHLSEYFVGRGYRVLTFDLRGHGRSSGARGYIGRWAEYREDVHTMVQLARAAGPAVPVHLVGHSMGGLISIDYALHYGSELRGLVAMGPALGDIGVSPILMRVSRVMSRVWPGFGLDTGLDSANMSRDPKAVERLDADPLVHGRGTARLGTELVAAIARVRGQAGEFAVPLLLQHGADDKVAAPEGTTWFYERVRHPDKELRIYPGGYHNLFVDLNWREVLGDVEEWVSRRLGPVETGG